MMERTLLLSWGLNGTTGWGLNGFNLARHASLAGWRVYSAGGVDWSSVDPTWKLEGWAVHAPDLPGYDAVIYAAGNGVKPVVKPGLAKRWLIATFLEDTQIAPEIVDGYNQADAVICGSQWNVDLLQRAGVDAGKLRLVFQGADSYLTANDEYPMRDRWRGPRWVFSGGKLEFRKGQDVVVAAFREYLKHQPDALLVTAWQNSWPQTMKGIDAMGYVKGWPKMLPNGLLDIVGWCASNGIPRKNVVDVGLVPSWALQRVIASCDVAVFPNRAEGGTNLVATESLCIGTAVAATLCTGQSHLADWTGNDGKDLRVIPHTPVTAACSLYRGTEGWGEPDIPALVAAMDHTFYPYPDVPSWQSYAEGVLRLCE